MMGQITGKAFDCDGKFHIVSGSIQDFPVNPLTQISRISHHDNIPGSSIAIIAWVGHNRPAVAARQTSPSMD